VNDVLAAGYRTDAHRRIGDVALNQLRVRRNVLPTAAGKIVNNPDTITATQETFDDVGTDETGAAGDEIQGQSGGSLPAARYCGHPVFGSPGKSFRAFW